MKLVYKVIAVTVGIILIIALLGLTSYLCLDGLIASQTSVRHTLDTLWQVDQILLKIREGEGTGRGYVITGEQGFRDQFNQAISVVPKALKEVERLTAADSEQQKNLAELAPLVRTKLDVMSEYVQLRSVGDLKGAAREVSHGGRLMEMIDNLTDKIAQREMDALEQRKSAAKEDARDAFLSIGFGSGLAAFSFCIFAFFFTRSVIGSIKRLTKTAERASAGKADLSGFSSSDDEFGELSNAILTLSHNLRSTLATASEEKGAREKLLELLRSAKEQLNKLASIAGELQLSSAQHAGGFDDQNATINTLVDTTKELEDDAEKLVKLARTICNCVASVGELKDAGQDAYERTAITLGAVKESAGLAAQNIEALSTRIGDLSGVVATVNDIGTRINPIALACAVESARPSVNGKELSVLVSELKAVSETTSAAAQKAHQNLFDVQAITTRATASSDATVKSLKSASEQLESMAGALKALPAPLEEAKRASSELSDSINRHASSMAQLEYNLEKLGLSMNDKSALLRESAAQVKALTEGGAELDKLLGTV